jgi:hypothetical protein
MSIAVIQNSIAGTGGTGTLTITLGTSVPVGGVIAVALITGNNALTPPSVTDNVNSGNYSLISQYHDSTNDNTVTWYWITANAAGAPVITITGVGNYTVPFATSMDGFVGTPTLDSAMTATFSATSGTTLACSPLSNTVATNEIVLAAICLHTGYQVSAPTGWTSVGSGVGGYISCSTLGQNPNPSGTFTFSASSNSDALVIGIYDSTGGGPDTLMGQAIL